MRTHWTMNTHTSSLMKTAQELYYIIFMSVPIFLGHETIWNYLFWLMILVHVHAQFGDIMKHELMRHLALGKQMKFFESIKKENELKTKYQKNLQLLQWTISLEVMKKCTFLFIVWEIIPIIIFGQPET